MVAPLSNVANVETHLHMVEMVVCLLSIFQKKEVQMVTEDNKDIRMALAEFISEVRKSKGEVTPNVKQIAIKYQDLPDFKELAATVLAIMTPTGDIT